VSRDPILFLEDIATACHKIVGYTDRRERNEVFRDEMRFEAILFNLHVIGEAVKKLPDGLRARHPEIAWREIAGMRDFVAHAYFALDLDILWNALQVEVPDLLPRIRAVIAAETLEQGAR
jgi:uncharacterized protein with HEPN domain